MPLLASAHEVQTHIAVSHSDGKTKYRMTEFFGGPGKVVPGPQSFLADTASQSVVVRPHFHVVDQFQVFWEGGKVGNRTLNPVHVHYHDAYTIYGPITASAAGLRYMTIRAQADPDGPLYMPGSREQRGERREGRHLDVSVSIPGADSTAPELDTVLGPHDDGLAVRLANLPPGRPLPPSGPSGGVHYLVLGGTLDYNGREHPAITDFFVEDDGPGDAKAGPEGLVALVLQFPARRSGEGRE